MSAKVQYPADIGERMRMAREDASLTQAQAAEIIGVARTTLVAIEKGERRIRTEELHKASRLYKISVNALLRQEAVHVDLAPQFRKMETSSEKAAHSAARLLTNLVKAEVELENLLGIARSSNYPPERSIQPGNIFPQAEAHAAELRRGLGLGSTPVQQLSTILEFEMGARIYIRPLHSQISGLFAFDKNLGACILLNALHPISRRNQTLAHELGHLVSSRQTPDILHQNERAHSREERYANAFGRAFLTPADTVRQKFSEITTDHSRLTRRNVIVLAHIFGVSREAIVRRLEELKLVKRGAWDWFQENGGITNEQARQVLGGIDVGGDHAVSNTLRLEMLAGEAWHRDLLSEGQLAKLLQLNRIELRKRLAGHALEDHAANA